MKYESLFAHLPVTRRTPGRMLRQQCESHNDAKNRRKDDIITLGSVYCSRRSDSRFVDWMMMMMVVSEAQEGVEEEKA